MKKLFLILFIIPLTVNAQSRFFKLTPDGFQNRENPSLDYIVVDCPGKDKVELYKRALTFLNKQFVSAQNVLSPIENETVSINAKKENIANYWKRNYIMNYTISVQFKDEKIRIDMPTINDISDQYNFRIGIKGNRISQTHIFIWNLKGDLKLEQTVKDVENFFDR